jgi:AhpD family alkylhydroperoxidase
MPESLFPHATPELAKLREELGEDNLNAWRQFSRQIFAEGALPAKTKQLIAVAVAHVTQCPYCIHSHTQQALKAGASGEEIMEAVWIAAEMRAGAAVAHSALALDVIRKQR